MNKHSTHAINDEWWVSGQGNGQEWLIRHLIG